MDSNASEGAESSETTLEIQIRTLDSSTHTIRVEKNITVPALKEQISSLLGVPAANQRLIYKGRVLKDDQILSAYNVEDGHTLHLVTRSAAESQGEQQNSNQQNQADAAQQGRHSQVTHSLLLGTINIPNAGDGGLPDFNRIVSAVLGGIGGAAAPNVQQAGAQQIPQRQGSLPIGGNPFIPRNFEIANDALSTMSIYLSRMEQMFAISGYGSQASAQPSQQPAQTGNQAPNQPSSGNQPSTEPSIHPQGSAPAAVPPNAAGEVRPMMTPAALGLVIRRVQELLTNQVSSSFSTLAGQLEHEPSTLDVPQRAEVQLGALWSANVMQQLGSLLLELGRSTMALHMGYSPAAAVVNTGPAVYVSTLGPNPLMVQPSAFQPLGSFTPRVSPMQNTWPAVSGPRSLNIHIHASDVGVAPGTNPVQASAAPAAGQAQTDAQPGLDTTEGSQTVPQGSAVVQETIMIIQDSDEASYDPSAASQPGTTTTTASSTINMTGGVEAHAGTMNPGQAQIQQVLERMFPGAVTSFRTQNPTQPTAETTSSTYQMDLQRAFGQGAPAAAFQTPQTSQGFTFNFPAQYLAQMATQQVNPNASAAPPSLATAQTSSPQAPAVQSSAPQAQQQTEVQNAAVSTSEPAEAASTPAGLGRQPLLRPRRRTLTRPEDSSRSRQSDPRAAGDGHNLMTSLMGQLMRSPAVESLAQQVMQGMGETAPGSGGGEQASLDVGRIMQQALPIVSQLLASAPGAPPRIQASATGQASQENTPEASRTSEDAQVKSEKIDTAVKQLENGEPPEQVIRSIAQAAAESASVNLSEAEVAELVDSLSDDYASLVLQDITSRLSES